MTFLETMQAYFRGERIEALCFIIPLGLALVGLAVVAIRVERGGFAVGLAVPFALFGLVALVTGGAVAARTERQVETIQQDHASSPAKVAERELPRMQKVNADFRTYFAGFAILVAGGLTLLLVVDAPWARGLGPALILIGGLGFVIDGFASRRALHYTAALEALVARRCAGRAPAPGPLATGPVAPPGAPPPARSGRRGRGAG